jgi:hypothetical protein
LFEQNAFNVMAWREPSKVQTLDLWRWNVHGRMLARIAVAADGKITCYDRPVIGLHATSPDPTFLKHERHGWTAGGKAFTSDIRLFTHPTLRELQCRLFARFVADNGSALATIF